MTKQNRYSFILIKKFLTTAEGHHLQLIGCNVLTPGLFHFIDLSVRKPAPQGMSDWPCSSTRETVGQSILLKCKSKLNVHIETYRASRTPLQPRCFLSVQKTDSLFLQLLLLCWGGQRIPSKSRMLSL